MVSALKLLVIVNGDSVSPVASASAGAQGLIPPKTTEQKLARKNEIKAKSTLMLAIPDEHLLKFHACKDAKSLWEAIKNRFRGNKESKRMQKTILKQNYENFEDAHLKLLRSLPSAWNNIALIMRNKYDLDTLSMDDLYNNLKVYESEIKVQSSSSLNSQNVAFVSSDNSSSTNETVNTTNNLDNEDLEQIDADDFKEIDLKWQVAMLTIRDKRFIKKIGRKLNLNDKETVGFDRTKAECYNCHMRGHFARECKAPRNQGNRNRDAPRRNAPDEEGLTNFALMAYTSQGSSSSDSEVHTFSKDRLKSYEALQTWYDQQCEALNKSNLEIIGYQMGLESLEARIVVHEKSEAVYEENIEILKYDVQVKDISIKDLKNHAKDKTGLGYDSQINESELNNVHKNESEVIHSVFNSRESDVDDNPVNDRFKTSEGFHAVPPPYTRNYMSLRPDLSFAGLDESVFKSAVRKTTTSMPETKTSISKTSKDIVEKPKTVRPSAPIIEEWDTNNDNDSVFRPKSNQTKPKFTKINFVKSGENVKSVNKENTHRQVEYPRKSQSPRGNRRNWNGMMTQKLGNGFEFIKKACFVCGSFNHLIKDYDFHDNKMIEKPALNNKGRVTAVVIKSGQVPVNATKQSSPRATTSIRTVRPVNIAAPKPKVNDALPITYSYFQAHSPVKNPINKRTVVTDINFNKKNTAKVNNVTTAGPKAVVSIAEGNGENAVKSSSCWIWRPTGNVIDHISKDSGSYMLKRFDYVDLQGRLNGYSRHMAGNKSYLIDYQEIDGGFELKFNIFSVLQMCDKKNSVLYTDTECVVLSPDFKLPDESQVLLKVPRNNNMYSFDLKNVVPLGGLTCLFAKATLDESNLWHRRLGHINFKTINKLVRGNLVRGRKPSLSFMRPFGCLVTILNTLDHLGTRPNWMFDIDTLTMSMNYQPVSIGNQTNGNAGPKSLEDEVVDDAGQKNGVLDPTKACDKNGQEKDVRDQEEALRKQFEQEFERFSSFTKVDPGRERAQRNEFESVFGQNKDANGNSIYRMFTHVSAARSSYDNIGGSIPVNVVTLPNADLPTNPLMIDLEDTADLHVTGIFNGAYDDEVESKVADFNNLELTTVVSPIPTTRIHKDHPKEQIIRDPLSTPQTRRMTKSSQEHAMKVTQALTDPSWIEAMQDELLQFRLQEVWILVDLHKGKHAIGTKWVYRNKKDERGIVVRNKARLVAQGYTQEEGIDYDEVFAPVTRIEATRLFLAYASFMGFIVYQMDVKIAFLYGIIEEEAYVCQPPGFEDPRFPDKVYKVEKGSYSLRQAPRAWELTFFLGLQVMQRDDVIFISQDKYVADILKKFNFSSVKTTSTLIETNKALLKDKEAKDVDVHLYISMIGSLMYLIASRPDIMFAVCACGRFQVTPKVSHLHAVKRIFRYLKGQSKLGLWYPRDLPFDLKAFSDSDDAGASLDRKSITRGCQFLGKRLILWQCKKQTVVANSTTKAEYVAAANCYGHVLWIQNQIDELGVKTGSCKVNATRQDLVLLGENLEFIDQHNMVACLERIDGNAEFHQIATAKSKTVNDVKQIHATVDGKTVVISESSVRSDLHFNDEDGITCLSNDEIFVNLALMGYERVSTKLTFQKAFFSPQWKYLIHTILHCLSSKTTAWNEFSTNLASAVICLAKGQKFNFSKLIFDGMLRNLDPTSKKFLMYPRFLQLFLNNQIALAEPFNDVYVTPVHTKKVFTNMKRQNKDFSGTVTPLFASMLVPQVVEGEGSGQPSEPQPPSSTAPPSHEEQVTTVVSQSQKTHTPRRAKRGQDTEIPQSSSPPKKVGDEAIYTREETECSGSGPRCQDTTLGDADAQTRFETASKQSCDPPLSEVNTSGSGEDSMEHQDDLTDFVPPTPHDSPLLGGHTPGSDEGRPNINELMAICTRLSNRVLALETSKTAQDLVIKKLKNKVKRLEKKQRARTLGMKLFKIGTSRRKSLDKENVSK
ncbi:putative ribonuclease H-like domain-containing protein [Tanacetum coccineum]